MSKNVIRDLYTNYCTSAVSFVQLICNSSQKNPEFSWIFSSLSSYSESTAFPGQLRRIPSGKSISSFVSIFSWKKNCQRKTEKKSRHLFYQSCLLNEVRKYLAEIERKSNAVSRFVGGKSFCPEVRSAPEGSRIWTWNFQRRAALANVLSSSFSISRNQGCHKHCILKTNAKAETKLNLT